MDITDTYLIKIEGITHYVYEGICDKKPTKWITKTKWDGKIKIQIVNDEIKYKDNDNNLILIFDEDDIEYQYITK